MRITISQETEQYIRETGYSVMILTGPAAGCCGAVLIPSIHTGYPKNLSGYMKSILGDITLFIDMFIDTEKKIRISME